MIRDTDNKQESTRVDRLDHLDTELAPPPALERQVVEALKRKQLVREARPRFPAPGWQVMRVALATAAGIALVAFGVLIGRSTGDLPASNPLTGAETDLYALLLLETAGYDRPSSAQARARYGEYSRWVADAKTRGLFVTGEDLDVARGWLVNPGQEQPTITETSEAIPAGALSGIFFIRATAPEQALELAAQLPHLAHGGAVLVQKTIPTDTPPD